ncbi:hypothetical protein [Winogradskyella tangerina]|uniref:hypothetical protein n=1 Tax=Winogradskyella tangerina TaxID=2023240 RepID=UPI00130040DA|nr:hypothetical protein [Winogradskyella tangerina]
MTKIKFLLILLVATVIYCCSTNDINEESTEVEFIEGLESKISNTKDSDQQTDSFRTIDEIEDLELKMQWVSYLTAQVLFRDTNARRQFEEEFDFTDGIDVVALEDLIGDHAPYDHFRNTFKTEFLFHYHYTSGDGSSPCDVGKPSGRPAPIIDGGDLILDDDVLFNNYVDYLLNDDCLEYYLPNGLNTMTLGGWGLPGTYTSTAHPLTDSNNNYAFTHRSLCNVSHSRVRPSTLGNIIVVRPFRTNTSCPYTDYPQLNFTDFLN